MWYSYWYSNPTSGFRVNIIYGWSLRNMINLFHVTLVSQRNTLTPLLNMNFTNTNFTNWRFQNRIALRKDLCEPKIPDKFG